MSTLAQIARQTRRGLFGVQASGAGHWRDSIKRFQSARVALGQGIQNLDELAAVLVNQNDIENCYRARERLSKQAAVMDGTANAIQSVSKVMTLSGLDDVGLFGLLNVDRSAYPATCMALDTISANAEQEISNLNRLGLFQATETFGGALWEFLHPGTVQEEFVATGNVAPSKIEIMSGASERMQVEASEAIGSFKSFVIVAAVIGVGVLFVLRK